LIIPLFTCILFCVETHILFFAFCSWRVSLGILKAAAQLHPRASFSLEVKKRGTLNHQSAELWAAKEHALNSIALARTCHSW
jgi:hypothetical protein